MKDPYSDAPGNTGIYYYTDQELYDNIRKAHCAGMQVCIHTIGDGALEQVLNAYERVLHDFPRENHRHRLVHGQVGNLALYKKIAELGLNINIQPASTSTDIPIMEARPGQPGEILPCMAHTDRSGGKFKRQLRYPGRNA